MGERYESTAEDIRVAFFQYYLRGSRHGIPFTDEEIEYFWCLFEQSPCLLCRNSYTEYIGAFSPTANKRIVSEARPLFWYRLCTNCAGTRGEKINNDITLARIEKAILDEVH